MPAGRPRIEWTEEQLTIIENAGAQGMSSQQVADLLGIARQTIENHKHYSDEFLACIKKGQARGVDRMSRTLMAQAENGSTAAAIFYLKAKAGWSDQPTPADDQVQDLARAVVQAVRAMDEIEAGDADT